MNKVDLILFRYKNEKTLSKKYKRFLYGMLSPIIVLLLLDIFSIVIFSAEVACAIQLFSIIIMLMYSKVLDGKLAPRAIKYKLTDMLRYKFVTNQELLVKIVREEGMNCQQIYNLLIKKYSRIPHSVDRPTFLITIISLIVALLSVLAPNNTETYNEYLNNIMRILVFLLPIGYGLYKIVTIQSNKYENKKKDYEYILDLLEEYLS